MQDSGNNLIFIIEVNDNDGKNSILICSVVQLMFPNGVYHLRLRIYFCLSTLFNREKPKRKYRDIETKKSAC